MFRAQNKKECENGGTMYEGNQTQPQDTDVEKVEQQEDEPAILDDICVEELAIDGICGVY